MPTPVSQNATYIGVNVQDILYGIELVLYFETVHAALMLKKKQRADVFFMLFSTIMLVLITIWIAATGIFGEEAWVIHGARPGGADAYWLSHVTGWYLDLARAAIFLLQLMTDALLIYRCWAIWGNAFVIIVPSVLWFASLVLGVMQTWLLSSHEGRFLHSISSHMALAYYAVCVFLNTTLTLLICYRIIRHGRLVSAGLGREFSSVYFAATEVIVESALPFTLSGIAFLVTLGLGLQIMVPFSWVYFMMTCISPQMLIRRVLRGKNMSRVSGGPTSLVSDIRFHHCSDVPVQAGNEPEGALHLSSILKVETMGQCDTDGVFASKKDVPP